MPGDVLSIEGLGIACWHDAPCASLLEARPTVLAFKAGEWDGVLAVRTDAFG